MSDFAEAGRIRPIVICLFSNGSRILVGDLQDPSKNQRFYRPLGGGIEYGESSVAALRREVREELGMEIVKPSLLGTLENIFTYDGKRGHEIVFVYDARLADERIYRTPRFQAIENNGEPFDVCWLDLDTLGPNSPPLYPDGLLKLIG